MSRAPIIMIIGLSLTLGYFFGEIKRSETIEKASKPDRSLSSENLLKQKFMTIEMTESVLPLQNNILNVVNFWATWCPPCRKEIPIFNKKFSQHFENGIGIIGIALDEEDQIKDFLKKQPIDYPHFFGQQDVSELMSHFGNSMGVLPFTVLTDSNGKYLSSVVGEISYESLSEVVSNAQRLVEKSQKASKSSKIHLNKTETMFE